MKHFPDRGDLGGYERTIAVVCVSLGLGVLPARPTAAAPPNDPGLVATLTPILKEHRLPAMAGAIVTRNGVERQAAIGVRKSGAATPVAVSDRWHLGSETKAMTAVLTAGLVEAGRLRFDTTLRDLFPELASSMHVGMGSVTVRQLLTHRAGLPANVQWRRLGAAGTLREQRMAAVREAVSTPPKHPPGQAFLYSNLGYVVVGAALEKITGSSWETLMETRVFKPLRMETAGFGGTGTPGLLDQPWPHRATGEPMPMNGPTTDNPPVLGPAGTVHASISDWGKFIADQLRGAQGEAALLKPASYAALQAPADGESVALGWNVTRRQWGGGTVLTHAGCNTMNYAVVWMAPLRGFAVLVCVNQGDAAAAKAADAAAYALILSHLEATKPPTRRAPSDGSSPTDPVHSPR